MLFLSALIYMAHLSRRINICVSKDDTRNELFWRYRHLVANGCEGAILNRLIRLVREENCPEGIGVRVEVAPYGGCSFTHDHCDIEDVEDLCHKLAELTVMVLKSRSDNG